MKSIFVFAITGLIIFSSLSFDNKNLAHADYGDDFCPDKSDEWGPITNRYTAEYLARIQYENGVYSFNIDMESRLEHMSIDEVNGIMVNPDTASGSVEELDKMAKCLYEVYRIDPDSVEKFSDKGKAVLSYDMEKLIDTAPNLVKYAEVPEFGSLASVTMIISVLGVMLIHKRFQR